MFIVFIIIYNMFSYQLLSRDLVVLITKQETIFDVVLLQRIRIYKNVLLPNPT